MKASESGCRAEEWVVQVTHRGRRPPRAMKASSARLSRPPDSGSTHRLASMFRCAQLQVSASRRLATWAARSRATGANGSCAGVEPGAPRRAVERQPGAAGEPAQAGIPRCLGTERARRQHPRHRRAAELEVAQQRDERALRRRGQEGVVCRPHTRACEWRWRLRAARRSPRRSAAGRRCRRAPASRSATRVPGSPNRPPRQTAPSRMRTPSGEGFTTTTDRPAVSRSRAAIGGDVGGRHPGRDAQQVVAGRGSPAAGAVACEYEIGQVVLRFRASPY